ncbi:unnamed protein product [Danaus chrysippus]|uniref:(African queen) hypothetical protein n=1 Tax=Danaus chrysippus TaxID=151541 RepID=A0A8J2QL25_9NEOP|nr:unnamed protein product [Danaus chrysippus]
MESKVSRSLDHSNWWEPDHWKMRSGLISTSLEGADPAEIRNGWLTLSDNKARFQQKQLQEREQKIASLYESQQAKALERVRHSPSNGVTSTPTIPSPQTIQHQPGKVRQMFEERRTKAGIDKSYPLQPIQNTERTQPRKITNGLNKQTTKTTEKKTLKTITTNTHTVKKQNTTKVHKVAAVNGSGDVNHNHELDLNTNKTVQPLSNVEVQKDERDANDNTDLIENETFPELALEQMTPRNTPDTNGNINNNNNKKSSPAVTRPKSPVKSKPTAVTTPRKVTSDNKVSRENIKPRGAMQRTVNSSPQTSASKARPTAERSEGACVVCGRRFAPDRLARHQDICRKTHAKKRKPFDVLKHRLAGTEAEPFISRLRKTPANSSATKLQKPLNSTWRQKHEEFIQAIRAAKQVQAHLNAGGKLSDLPPPPPSENPDYVQCPHCKRRFNQAAADRHIPKCANFQFNKTKQAPKKR